MEYLVQDAIISPDQCYRYALLRRWKAARRACLFIGLNPSVADADEDDPTLRRCVNFADTWGMGAVRMVNLFAYRATDPQHLKHAPDPVGPGNDEHIRKLVDESDMIVAAWGASGPSRKRAAQVEAFLRQQGKPVHVLGFTAKGNPRHPLYMRADTVPTRWF